MTLQEIVQGIRSLSVEDRKTLIGILVDTLAEPTPGPKVDDRRRVGAESLLNKQQAAIRRAEAYRQRFGDPVDNLVGLLGQFVRDEDTWQDIVEEPYG